MGFCEALCRLPHLSIAPGPREADRARSRQIFSLPHNLLSLHKPSCKLTVDTGLQWLGLKSQEHADYPRLARRDVPQGRRSGFSKVEDLYALIRPVLTTGTGGPQNNHDDATGKGKTRKSKGGKWQKWAAFGGVGLSVVAAATRVNAQGMPNAETGGGGGQGGQNSGGGSGGGPGDGSPASEGNLFSPATDEDKPRRRKPLPFAFLGGGDRDQPLNPGSPSGSKTEVDGVGTGSGSPTTVEELSVDGEEEEEEEMSPLKTAVGVAEGNPLQQLWDRLSSVIRMLSDGQQKVRDEDDLSLEELAAQEERHALLLDSAELALKLIDERTGADAFARASEVRSARKATGRESDEGYGVGASRWEPCGACKEKYLQIC